MSTINTRFLEISTPKLEAVTEKYRFISTAEFIKDVESQGFKLVSLQGKGSGYGKHLMKFEREDLGLVNGDKIQLVAFTSHDGSKAFNLFLGYFRAVCSNGMIIGIALQSYKIRHVGYAEAKVAYAVTQCLSQVDELKSQVERMQSTQLNAQQAFDLALALRSVRPTLSLVEAIKPEREADEPVNVWTMLNRVQEKVMRGGENRDANGRRLRLITSPNKTVELNRKLWDIAASYKIAA